MISNRQQSLVAFTRPPNSFIAADQVTAMERTIPDDLLSGRGVCEEGGQPGNRRLDTLFQDAVRNTVAFALRGADLKQYIFAFVRQWRPCRQRSRLGNRSTASGASRAS
ncbi:hypothetical protein CPT32_23295 [Rhizobium sophoriradicis]|nr:hypothetical protein CPT32_23295 [Rhizobium sophoriradicis]